MLYLVIKLFLIPPLSCKVTCRKCLCSLREPWTSLDLDISLPVIVQAKRSCSFPLLIKHTMSSIGQGVNTFKTKLWKRRLTPSQPFKVQTSSQPTSFYPCRRRHRQDQNSLLTEMEKSQQHSVCIFKTKTEIDEM